MSFSGGNLKDVFRSRINKAQVSELVGVVSSSKELFDELISIIINGNRHEALMASWVLQYAAVKKPDWFYEHVDDILKYLEENHNESVLRSVARVFWKTKIPKEKVGLVTQNCIAWIENKESSIAVKAFSFHTLSKIIEQEPELCGEIKDITESILPYASKGLANSAEKLLGKINRMGY